MIIVWALCIGVPSLLILVGLAWLLVGRYILLLMPGS